MAKAPYVLLWLSVSMVVGKRRFLIVITCRQRVLFRKGNARNLLRA
jgi:hypothetical protein